MLAQPGIPSSYEAAYRRTQLNMLDSFGLAPTPLHTQLSILGHVLSLPKDSCEAQRSSISKPVLSPVEGDAAHPLNLGFFAN